MRALFVVLFDPVLSDLLNLFQMLKYEHVQHFGSIGSVEAFNKTVLHRPARFDELQGDTMLFGPCRQFDAGQFRTVINPQFPGITAPGGNTVQGGHHTLGRQAFRHFDG